MKTIYIILIGLHIFLSIMYAVEFRYEEDGSSSIQKALMRFVITLMIPVFGFLFLWFSDFCENRVRRRSRGPEQIPLFEQEADLDLLKSVDYDEEVNTVPMVEALKMGDYSFRRKMVVDTLREEDTLEYINMLKTALLNEDAETSHYASSVIMDIQGKIQAALTRHEEAFLDDPDNVENALAYEEELYRLIKSGIYEQRNLKKYYIKYKSVSDQLLAAEEVPESCYHHRIDIDFETEAMEHAEKICEAYSEAYPASEEMVVDNLKLCIKLHDRQKMDDFMAKLKKMPVMLTAYSLQYVRFFEQNRK